VTIRILRCIRQPMLHVHAGLGTFEQDGTAHSAKYPPPVGDDRRGAKHLVPRCKRRISVRMETTGTKSGYSHKL
jgi:hypothetical protein